jgi:hypothetical protein
MCVRLHVVVGLSAIRVHSLSQEPSVAFAELRQLQSCV